MKKTSLLDAQIGIGNILEPYYADEQMSTLNPKAQTLGVNTSITTSMEATYAPKNIQTVLEAAICPETGDGSLLLPSIFSANLQACKSSLADFNYYETEEFLEKDLKPLLENEKLLHMYISLMVEG